MLERSDEYMRGAPAFVARPRFKEAALAPIQIDGTRHTIGLPTVEKVNPLNTSFL